MPEDLYKGSREDSSIHKSNWHFNTVFNQSFLSDKWQKLSIFISGANRGVGIALVTSILSNNAAAFVYAGARNPDSATSLKDIEAKYPDRVSIVKCVSADIEGNAAIAKEIEKRHGRVDTVIANAALADSAPIVLETSLEKMEDHFRINVCGPMGLFQAVYPLLKKSVNPRFVTISSQAGSLDGYMVKSPDGGQTAYGASKAALNWVTRKIHFENDWLVVFPLSPGVVNTEMFQYNVDMDKTGHMQNWVHLAAKPEDAAASMLKIIDNSTRETHGGEFFNVDGQKADY